MRRNHKNHLIRMHTNTANRREPDFCVCCAEQYFICRIFPNKSEKTEEKFFPSPSRHSHTRSQPQKVVRPVLSGRENSRSLADAVYNTGSVVYYEFYYPRPSTPSTPYALVQFSILFALSLLPPSSGVDDACLCCCCWLNDKRMILMLLEDTNNKDECRNGREGKARLDKYV